MQSSRAGLFEEIFRPLLTRIRSVATFTSEANMTQNELIHQISHVKMEPRKADEYIALMMKLKDGLYAVNYPINMLSFNNYLIQGQLKEWDTFKTTVRGQTRLYTEEVMIATIRHEDAKYLRNLESEVAYAAKVPPKGRNNKGGSSASAR